MKLHGNARTCPNSRRLLVYRWLARWRQEGAVGLIDRSSRPQHSPRQLPADRVQLIRCLRCVRMTAAEIAEVLGLAISTVSLWLKRIGPGKRSRLDPLEPPNRYERRHAGELVHVDIKQLERISPLGAGHRMVGHRKSQRVYEHPGGKQRRLTRYEFVHVMVDDYSRLAYAEVLPALTTSCAISFLRRALPGSSSRVFTSRP